MILKIVNPFNYINPITKEEFFVGRENELETIGYILDLAESGSQYANIAITGKRAIGKTSLLNIILYRALKRKFLAVCVDLNEDLVSDSTIFFKEIIQSILFEGTKNFKIFGDKKEKKGLFRKFTEIVEGTNLKIEIPLLFAKVCVAKDKDKKSPEVSDTSLIHDFDFLRKEALKNNIESILIAIDEANLLSNNRVILQKIRNVFQKLDGYVIVLSGTESLIEELANVFSPIQRFFVRLNLNPFSENEIEDALKKPLKAINSKIRIDPHIIPDIAKMSGGYPYEVNLIAHFAFKIATQKKLEHMMLTKEVFNEIKNQKNQLIGFEQRFSSLSNEEQRILNHIVLFNGQMAVTEYARLSHDFNDSVITDSSVIKDCTRFHRPLFRSLEQKGFLTVLRKEGRKKIYGFNDKLLELYVKYTKVIPQVFKEYPQKHFHILDPPSFIILDKMLGWLLLQFPENILMGVVASNERDSGWRACFQHPDNEKERPPETAKLENFITKSLTKLLKENKISNAIPQFKKLLQKSLPEKIRQQNLEVLSKIIIDDKEMKVAFFLLESRAKTKVQMVFEEAMKYIEKFWTNGRLTVY